MMTGTLDFYQKLGVRRGATAEEVRQAYHEAARRLHPDRNTTPGETEFFLDIQEAYEVLSNPKKRLRYDAALPPEPASGLALEQRIQYSRLSLARLDEPQLIYTLLELFAPASLAAQLEPALNLCLVLDHSTSMQGSNMDMVKATAIQIMRRMKAEDIFSVVAFSDRAEQLIPATRGSDLKKLEARIHMLQPSGGTEIFQGLEMAYNETCRSLSPGGVHHIILITDGRTYGDEEQCLALACQASGQGVGISGLGIGSEWNDTFLDALAASTGGSSIYVSQPEQIQHSLLDKFNHLGRTYSSETRLDFKVPEGVELRYAFRLQPEAAVLAQESPLQLGAITRTSNLKVLMEFVVHPRAVKRKSVTLLEGSLKPKIPQGDMPEGGFPIHLVRGVGNVMGTDLPPAEIVEALTHLKLYRLQERARLEVSAGEFEQATEHLQRLASHLLSQGERGLARTVLLEAANIQSKKDFSKEGRKAIKYGTRALVMPGKPEDS